MSNQLRCMKGRHAAATFREPLIPGASPVVMPLCSDHHRVWTKSRLRLSRMPEWAQATAVITNGF